MSAVADTPETPDHEKSRRLLAALRSQGGVALTSDLREMLGMQTQTAGSHLRDRLVPAGYVEKVGEVDEGNPYPTNQWALTAKGERAALACGPALSEDDLRIIVQEQAETIETLEDRIEALAERVDEAAAEREQMKENVNWNTRVVEAIRERLAEHS